MVVKEPHSRRSFLNRFWLVLSGLAFAELIAVVFTFFKPQTPKATATSNETVFIAGPADQFTPGTVSAFIRGKFYLARLEDGGFLAMSRKCTHLSCTVPWVSGQNKFICPCHSSEFDIRGSVVKPPAPRAMDLYKVEIKNNVISVDTSQLRKRSEFGADQVTYLKKA